MNHRMPTHRLLRKAIGLAMICLLAATHTIGSGSARKHPEIMKVGMPALLA